MNWLQLDPENVARRARESFGAAKVPSAGKSVAIGVVGFTVLSVAGFLPWAAAGRWFYRNVGELGMYLACALVFIGLSGPLLHRLIIGPGSLRKFYAVFAVSFTVYSALWIAGWMLVRGHPGSVVGLLAGTAAMGWILARAFDAKAQLWKTIAALFVLNSVGYFVGGVVEGHVIGLKEFAPFGTAVSKRTQALIAKSLWGVFYGLGFGAGLGLAFYFVQERTRAFLRGSLVEGQVENTTSGAK
ncbi:MAG TPA: hypothetical protein VF773_03815 [Verrucomicrobiae bacterium]